jgi:FtsZ-interacting cell division protein ZipA
MMTDFQLALAGVAVVAVVLVIVYNRWQESKYRKRAERMFATDHHDVLIDSGERVEPSLGELPRGLEELDGTDSPVVSAPIVPRSAESQSAPALNADVDSIALILADKPISPDQYHPAIAQSMQLHPGILWEGLASGLWQPVEAADDSHYRELRAGIQLASRDGPIDQATLQVFDEMVARFASEVNAVSQREALDAALKRAQMLDNFCADTDIEIAVNLVGKSGVTFAVTKVRGLAEAQGMTQADSGEFVMKDELGRVLFTLRNMDPAQPPGIGKQGANTYLTGLSFALDVPRVHNPARAFERMFNLALTFADVLQGEVVDDNKKQLTANGRKVIADTIAGIADRMVSIGVSPGGTIALRLYA